MLADFRELINLNITTLNFAYGQVFFIIALSIFIITKRYTRLELVLSIRWISGFGFLHGFYVWGNLFIPAQAVLFPSEIIGLFRIIQLILLAGSYGCLFLFAFGLLEKEQQLKYFPAGMIALWLICSLLMGLILGKDPEQWRNSSEIAARYLLGFPSTLMSAHALRLYKRDHISTLKLSKIYRKFKIAGLSIAAYGLFSGLFGPEAPFFPASVLNEVVFTDILIFPPLVFCSVFGLIFAYSMVISLLAYGQETNRLIAHMEREAVSVVERKRVARNLHDTTFQRLYAAGLMVQSFMKNFDDDTEAYSTLSRLMDNINEVITELQSFLLGLSTADNSTDISSALKTVIEEAQNSSGLEVNWEGDSEITLTAGRVSHVVTFLRECLSNVARHSDAHSTEVKLTCRDNRVYLTIVDDGQGLPEDVIKGYGMRDMHDRARLLGGDVSFISKDHQGTIVTLNIPLKDEI